MIIGINSDHQIEQVGEITDETLTVIDLPDTDDAPFYEWPIERVLCYCYKAEETSVSVYPYKEYKEAT